MPSSTSGCGDAAAALASETEVVSKGPPFIVTPGTRPLRPSSYLERFGFLGCLFDCSDVHKCLLGKMVPLAVEQLLEAAHRIGDGDVLSGYAREHFGHVEWL